MHSKKNIVNYKYTLESSCDITSILKRYLIYKFKIPLKFTIKKNIDNLSSDCFSRLQL